MQRRRFLGFLAASPIAAKSVAETTLEQTKYSVFGRKVTDMGPNPESLEVAEASPTFSRAGIMKKLRRLANGYLRDNKLPRFKEFEIRRRAMEFNGLDADLASMRSMSVSHKIKVQKERNIQRLRIEAIHSLVFHEDRQAWFHKHNQDGHYVDWY